MSAYDFNPELCLQVLYGIAEEIPSGVSGKILGFVRNAVIVRLKQLIEWLWKKYQIPHKLNHLEELEKESHKHMVAWRPTTGKVDLNWAIGKYLLMRKLKLEKEIEVVRKKSAMITPYIRKISEQSNQQLEELLRVEKKISDRHNRIKE